MKRDILLFLPKRILANYQKFLKIHGPLANKVVGTFLD